MLHLKVGDGKIILFCCDAWLGHTPLKAMFPNLFTVAQKSWLKLINIEIKDGKRHCGKLKLLGSGKISAAVTIAGMFQGV